MAHENDEYMYAPRQCSKGDAPRIVDKATPGAAAWCPHPAFARGHVRPAQRRAQAEATKQVCDAGARARRPACLDRMPPRTTTSQSTPRPRRATTSSTTMRPRRRSPAPRAVSPPTPRSRRSGARCATPSRFRSTTISTRRASTTGSLPRAGAWTSSGTSTTTWRAPSLTRRPKRRSTSPTHRASAAPRTRSVRSPATSSATRFASSPAPSTTTPNRASRSNGMSQSSAGRRRRSCAARRSTRPSAGRAASSSRSGARAPTSRTTATSGGSPSRAGWPCSKRALPSGSSSAVDSQLASARRQTITVDATDASDLLAGDEPPPPQRRPHRVQPGRGSHPSRCRRFPPPCPRPRPPAPAPAHSPGASTQVVQVYTTTC